MIQTLFLTSASATLRRSRASRRIDAGEFRLEFDDAFALGEDALLGLLVGIQDGLRQFLADLEAETPDEFAGILVLLIDGEALAQAEFGIVFEERVGPGRSAAFGVGAVGRGGQVGAVDGGAAGGIGDHHAVAEELGDQLDVRGFAAAGAGAGELKERPEQLDVLHLGGRKQLAVGFGKAEEEIPIGGFGFAQRRLGHHIDGAVLDFALALGGADFDAEGAAGAIFGRDLKGVLAILHVLPARGDGFEAGGRVAQVAIVVDLGADHGMRADQDALAALYAEGLVPHGDFEGDVALLPLRGGGGEGAVDGHGADREIVAIAGDDLGEHVAARRPGRRRGPGDAGRRARRPLPEL